MHTLRLMAVLAHPDDESRGLLACGLEHAGFAEPGFADHE